MKRSAVVLSSCLAIAGLATCAPRVAGAPEPLFPGRQAWASDIDWVAAQDEAVSLLSGYLQVDTSNPPGLEERGAIYLADKLTAEGIESEIRPFAPGRANLIARLRAQAPEEAPLCLMSHIDVATAEAEHWQQPPFSGLVDDEGYIWGRGAIDMKAIGAIELLSLVWLKRLGVPLRRDVVLLAVGDEEVDNAGVKALAETWSDIGCSHLLNEGGMGVTGALVDDLTTFAVSFTEKGALWLKMWARGEPGHGSTPLDDAAPLRLVRALDALSARKVKPTWHPETFKLLRAIGERAGGITGAVLKSPSLTKSLAAGQLMDHPLSRAVLTNTVNVTGFGGAEEPNVVPSAVWAQLDVRMLPGVTSADMLAELEALVEDVPGISFEVLADLPAVESPTDDPLYGSLVNNLQRSFPDAAVGPLIMMGTTDSQVLRPLGVHAYGFAPFVFSQDDLRGMHGHDERIHKDNLGRGLKVLLGTVLEVAAQARGPVSTASAGPGAGERAAP